MQRYMACLKLDTDSPAITDGVQYLLTSVPDAVRRLGAKPEALEHRFKVELAKRMPSPAS